MERSDCKRDSAIALFGVVFTEVVSTFLRFSRDQITIPLCGERAAEKRFLNIYGDQEFILNNL